jgi:preprotein translocase subunit SecE
MLKKLLFPHKTDQAMMVRGTGLGLIAALLFFGCYGLYFTIQGWWDALQTTLIAIPLVNIEINGALILAIVVFVGSVLLSAYILGRPKTADLLIDTESELLKVTWPSWPETVNASMVVIFTTVLMAVLLFVYDLVLGFLTKLVL